MHHSKHQTGNEPVYTDPVCGMKISRTAATAEFEYQGKTYYFCAPDCQQAFQAEPGKYVHHHRQRGVKPGE